MYSCDYYDDRLVIVNKLNTPICFDFASDTVLPFPSINEKEYFMSVKISEGDSQNIVIPGSQKQWTFEALKSKDSTLSIFVFNYDTVLNNNWDSLILRKAYKRIDTKLSDLEKLGWRVVVE